MQGQYIDDETGLCYNRFRYFDSGICSFVSQDPIGLAAGENVYAYALNVWGWVDPLGLESGIPDILIGTDIQNIQFSGKWQTTKFANDADSIVYVLRDAKTGELLKVGKSGVNKFIGRFSPYAKAGQRTGRTLELDAISFKKGDFSAEAVEKQIRENLRRNGHRLPWDNTGGRLGRQGPGVPGASLPRRLRSKYKWDYGLETLVPKKCK